MLEYTLERRAIDHSQISEMLVRWKPTSYWNWVFKPASAACRCAIERCWFPSHTGQGAEPGAVSLTSPA
jgi:hypothetical protein